MTYRFASSGAAALAFVVLSCLLSACQHQGPNSAEGVESKRSKTNKAHLSSISWTAPTWQKRCANVRTSYNPSAALSDEALTLVPGKKRWLDFVFWTLNNKIAEHQVEAYGGTDWDGPSGGVIFHWAPGSHWERDTLASFGFTIGHVIGEHKWRDTMFPDFFEKYGGVYGVNVKDRIAEIDGASPNVWVEFLEHIGGATSPYYRYLFHQEAVVDPAARAIHLLGGQGVAFSYSFERYYHELREVLTDCRAADFFQMYDRFGHGFASQANWARQDHQTSLGRLVGYAKGNETAGKIYEPNPPAVDVPKDLREAESLERGKGIYLAQCAVCHGVRGGGRGFLAGGFDVKPRDFTRGQYKFRSTGPGEFPTMADIEKTVREGIRESTMPAWGQFLSAEQITDVSRYLVVFNEDHLNAWRNNEELKQLSLPSAPNNLSSLAKKGTRIWNELQCAKCHGATGRGDGPSAAKLIDSLGDKILPTDLSNKWSFKGGHTPEEIYRTFMTGLDGTPMPSYASAIGSPVDAWALVAYVLALTPNERPVIRLEAFAKERGTRIGLRGQVLP